MKKVALFCLLLLSVSVALAQQRKDSIQIFFPDSVATSFDTNYLNTASVLDSIVASLALPQNAGRPIIVSALRPPVTDDGPEVDAQDSIATIREESVAQMLVDHGVKDSLITFDSGTFRISDILPYVQSATLMPHQEDVLQLLRAAEFYSESDLQDTLRHYAGGTPYLYIQQHILPLMQTVWLQIPGGEWLGTGDYAIPLNPADEWADSATPADVLATADSQPTDSAASSTTDDTATTSPEDQPLTDNPTPATEVPDEADTTTSLAVTTTPTVDTDTPPADTVTPPADTDTPTAAATPPPLTASAPPAVAPTSVAAAPAPARLASTTPKTSPAMDSLQDLITAQRDTIAQLRQQLAQAAAQSDAAAPAAAAAGSDRSYYLTAILLLCLLLLLAAWYYEHRRRKAAEEEADGSADKALLRNATEKLQQAETALREAQTASKVAHKEAATARQEAIEARNALATARQEATTARENAAAAQQQAATARQEATTAQQQATAARQEAATARQATEAAQQQASEAQAALAAAQAAAATAAAQAAAAKAAIPEDPAEPTEADNMQTDDTPATATPAAEPTPESAATPAPTAATASVAFEGMFRGKSLYESLEDGSCTSVADWTNTDILNFIEYYRLQHREFVDALENEYSTLSRNHKLFLILVEMGKSDAEIQKLMGITQTTIRSIRFRIKAKKLSSNIGTQTHIFFDFLF